MCRQSKAALAILALAIWLAAGTASAQAPPVPPGGEALQVEAPVGAVEAPGAAGGVLVPNSEFQYDPSGRRDPFKTLLQLEKKKRDVSQLPPIQQFDLDTVKVVGVVVDPSRSAQAMLRSAGGQTFVVRVGTIIGKNEGEVTEITMAGVTVVEKFLDFMNRETRKETFLKSHPTAGK